jgi:hypothetical protein
VPHPCAETFSLGGTVSGLSQGSSVSLFDGESTISVSGNESFAFAPLPAATSYDVTVSEQPTGQFCFVTNAQGVIGNQAVTNVAVTCISMMQPLGVGWTNLATPVPAAANIPPPDKRDTGSMHLLSDGTLLVQADSYLLATTGWWRLTPDPTGHYVSGTWSSITPSNCPHGDFASQLLQDGRFAVFGGEYGATLNSSLQAQYPNCVPSSGNDAGADSEVYDPMTDRWTTITPSTTFFDPTQHPDPVHDKGCGGTRTFGDAISEMLPNGAVLIAPIQPMLAGQTLIYDPNGNPPWSVATTLLKTCNQVEASWVKLADGSILTVDPQEPSSPQSSERYIPSGLYPGVAGWQTDASNNLPALYDAPCFEEGPAFLLPNKNVIFFGSTSSTAIYTPSGTQASGTWAQGPDIPAGPGTSNGGGMPDAPGAMMPNGRILIEVSRTPVTDSSGGCVKPQGIWFYEYDYSNESKPFTQIAAPPPPIVTNVTTDGTNMVLLPDGTVLFSGTHGQLAVYQSAGPVLPQAQPVVSNVVKGAAGSYTVTGTNFNGISEGAAFGDDGQMSTNFPLVRLTDVSGKVQYLRTFNWNSTGVVIGASSVNFTLPASLAPGTYLLQVVANGAPSAPYVFNVPPPPNACGGTSALAGVPGEPCGQSCGRWSCNGSDALACRTFTNVCGGCSSIPIAVGEGSQPGENCTCANGSKGRFFCTPSKQLSCDCQP